MDRLERVGTHVVRLLADAEADGRVPRCTGCGKEFHGETFDERFIAAMDHYGYKVQIATPEEAAEYEKQFHKQAQHQAIDSFAQKIHNLLTDLFGPSKRHEQARWN